MSWPTGRLSRLAATWPSNVDKHTVEGETRVRLCNYTDVYKNDSITDSLSFMTATATDDQIERFRLRAGDTIITKDSETADDIGIPAFVEYEASDLICGYHLAIVRPSAAAWPRFVYWALRSEFVLRQWSVLASGVTRVALRRNDVSRVSTPAPPLEDQKRIADYLDRETARIDTLIAKQEQLIITLRERRTSTVTQLALAGLDPNVPMTRHSFLGDIPAAWKSRRFSRAISISGGQVDPHDEAWQDAILVAPNHVESGTGRITGRETVSQQGADSGKYVVKAGQILYSKIRPALNKVTIARDDGLCSADMYAMTASNEYDHEYLLYYLLSRPFVSYATMTSMRVKMPKINREELSEAVLPLPPLREQRQIADAIKTAISHIDNLIAKAERFIELSKERRAALITAAVTGQLEIPSDT